MAGNANFTNIGDLEQDGGDNFTFSEANMKYSTTTNNRGFILPVSFPDTGKYYYEMYILGVGGTQDQVFPGVCNPDTMRGNLTTSRGGATGTYGGYTYDQYHGYAVLNGTNQTADSIGYFRSFPQKMGILVNRDDNKIQWTLNGTDFSSAYTIPSGELRPYLGSGGGSTTASGYFNFGQDSTFGGNVSAGGNADSNGHGDFTFSVPSNYVSLSSANIPVSSDVDPAQTNNDIPSKQFGAETFTGNGGTQTIQLGDGFQPDLVITKNTGSSNSWIVLDSSRGYNKTLKLEEPDAESTNAYVGYGIESDFFASTGIKANDGGSPGFNNSTANYIVYGWRANGGTTSTNTSGTITTTVQANTAAGFSIVTYTGTGTNATIGHGLSQAPDTVWIKNRDQNDSWFVYLNAAGLGNNKFVSLDANVGSSFSGTSYFQATSPSSTVITLGTDHKLNASTEKYVAYCWHNVEGYSKFGQFTGNGDTDGPYVYTGFRPRFYMYISLRFSGSPHWEILDTARSVNNPARKVLQADANSAEYTSATRDVDFMSSGIKVRASDSYDANNSNGMAYWIWGDVPFKYNNAF